MKKVFKGTVAIAALTAMIFCAGCGDKSVGKVNKGAGEIPKEISIFANSTPSLTGDMKDFNDVLGFQIMEEKTGCKINWILPPQTGYTEKFNLMIASGQYTDGIIYEWRNLNAKEFAEDGVIIPLKELIEENMPNFTKWCEENPELAKNISTEEDGEIYYIPFIRTDKKLNIFIGPLMRTDWLKELGLETPTNADELYNVLKAFKTQDPNKNGEQDEIPMSGVTANHTQGLCALLWMFDTADNFYVDGDKVKFGALEPEFKEGLSYIAKLYKEGLIDPDYILQDRTKMDSKMTNDKVGFMFSYQPTKISNLMAEKDPSFKLEGIPHLKSKGGTQKCYLENYADSIVASGFAISTSNPDPAGTLKWLDWIFSEEGKMTMNFGKEGDTYTMVDGYPTFTDKVLNNPGGYTVTEAFGRYSATFASQFPTLQDWRSYSQSLSPYGKAAIDTWAEGVDISGIMPKLGFSAEDQTLINDIMTPVNTYVDEMIDKVIIGQVSVDEWEKNVVSKIEKMRVREALEIHQKAYDKYLKR